MSLATTHRRLIATTLAIVVLAAAFAWVCLDGAGPLRATTSGLACAVMAHASALPAAAAIDAGLLFSAMIVVAAAAFAMLGMTQAPRPAPLVVLVPAENPRNERRRI